MPEHVFEEAKTYTVKATFASSVLGTKTVTKSIVAICPAPKSPSVNMYITNANYTDESNSGIDVWNVTDECIIGTENVEIQASPNADRCGSMIYGCRYFWGQRFGFPNNKADK